jgi:hypothetical protein
MAVQPHSNPLRDRRVGHPGKLRGPSAGIEAWTEFWMRVLDELIERRARWREHDPYRGSTWRPALHAGAWLVAIFALIERIMGG